MTVLRQYNTGTSTWDIIATGAPGTTPYVGGKNFVSNGAMDVWSTLAPQILASQNTNTGISSASASVSAPSSAVGRWFGPDRWYTINNQSGANNITLSQTSSVLEDYLLNTYQITDYLIPAGFRKAIQVAKNATITGPVGIWQDFESNTSTVLQGQNAVLSFWAKGSSNFTGSPSKTLQIDLYQGGGLDQSLFNTNVDKRNYVNNNYSQLPTYGGYYPTFSGIGSPTGPTTISVGIDSNNNVYALALVGGIYTIIKLSANSTNNSSYSTILSLGTSSSNQYTTYFTPDTNGNMYVSSQGGGNGIVYQITTSGSYNIFASNINAKPVVDTSGNLYFVTLGSNIVTKITPTITTAATATPGTLSTSGSILNVTSTSGYASAGKFTLVHSGTSYVVTYTGTTSTTFTGCTIASGSVVVSTGDTIGGGQTTLATVTSASNSTLPIIDSSNNIYFITGNGPSTNASLHKITSAGAVTTTACTGGVYVPTSTTIGSTSPLWFVLDSYGYFYVPNCLNNAGGSVMRVSSSGVFQSNIYNINGGLVGLTLDTVGNIWITDNSTGSSCTCGDFMEISYFNTFLQKIFLSNGNGGTSSYPLSQGSPTGTGTYSYGPMIWFSGNTAQAQPLVFDSNNNGYWANGSYQSGEIIVKSAPLPYRQSVTLTTSWQKFTILMPTFFNSTTQIGLGFSYVPSGATSDSFFLTGVQLEVGTTPTEFSRLGGSYEGELTSIGSQYSGLVLTSNNSTISSFGANANATWSSPMLFSGNPTLNNFKTQTFDVASTTTSTFTPTKGTIYYQAIYLTGGTQISAIYTTLTVAGVGLANCWLGIYNSTTQVAVSPVAISTAWQTTGFVYNPLSPTSGSYFVVPSTGVYWIALLVGNSSTTSPTFLAASGATNINNNLTAISGGLTGTRTGLLTTGQTALPASISGTPTNGVYPAWFGLS